MKSFKFLIISFVLLFTLISPGDAFGQTSLTPAEKAVAVQKSWPGPLNGRYL